MTEFTPLSSLVGGITLGVSALLLLYLNGRIAGVSSIVSGSFKAVYKEPQWQWFFVLGLILSPLALTTFDYQITTQINLSWPVMIIGGFLVGFGAHFGSGCTSGHGICGIGRLSPRSIVATSVFISVAVIVVFITKHLL